MFNWYKLVFFLGLCLILFVLLVYDTPKVFNDGKIELRLLANPPPGYEKKFEELILLFEKTHPNIRVKHNKAPGNYYIKVQTMMVGNTCSDVVMFSGKQINSFKMKGTLLNLMPLIKKDNYELDDYFEVGLEDAQATDQELHYLPLEGSGTVLYYNKDLFADANLSYPDESWTWQDFQDAAIKLTKDSDGDGRIDQAGCVVGYWWAEAISWIWSNGGNMVNKEHTKCLLNQPKAIEALNFILDLERKHNATAKSLGGTESAGVYENFASGRIGMIVALAYGLPMLMDATKGKSNNMRWGVAMPPQGKHGRPIRYTSSGWVIWSGTKHPNEAWELMKFLNSHQVMKAYCLDNHYVPARKSISLSPDFLNRAETPYDEKVLIQSLLASRPLDNIYALRSIASDFGIALDKARLGLSDIQVEMDKVVEKADAALNEYSASDAKTEGLNND
ncbi:MAG: sugar ABC transporter substrate-binding protein [Victivallaceae bacterium]|nr:sugar ABC transporter substrate-binding protein [Victivallaceae bacterium]